MFTDVPKLIGREFIVGFLLPSMLFFFISATPALKIYNSVNIDGSSSSAMIAPKDYPPDGNMVATIMQILDKGYAIPFVMIVAVWVFALLLLSLNWIILRLFEGYDLGRLTGVCQRYYRSRFEKTAQLALEHQRQIDNAREYGSDFPVHDVNHARNLWIACKEFPDRVEFVLPTKFGNRFRSFEVYSRVVYGLDAIPAWPRLMMVMPESARLMISHAKMQVDFCINTTVISSLAIPVWLLSWVLKCGWSLPWVLLVVLLLVLLSLMGYRMASDAVVGLGELVKSAFDLYRRDLSRALGLEHPKNAEDEVAMWQSVSRIMIYRSAAQYRQLDRFRLSQAEIDALPAKSASVEDD